MNVKNILRSIKQNPLNKLISKLEELNSDNSYNAIQQKLPEIHLAKIQYKNYFFSCERILNEISLERRFRNGPYYALKYRVKYTESNRKIADKFNKIKQYTELDFYNFIIHASMLLDCVTRIAQYFIKGVSFPNLVHLKVIGTFF